MITTQELKQKYFEFFEQHGHTRIPSASLIPENDPSVLFTTAGMHPLVPYLLGQKHPAGKRLVDVQKCVRTGDIDDIGDDTHLTFFEMLGNWSLGDYGKKESIKWSWDFLTGEKWLNLNPKKLSVTYFAGDANAPEDLETKQIWLDLGLASDRITPLPAEDNWWPTALVPGPCGPDTEIFYWRGEGEVPAGSHPGNDKTWVEIWNNVFMLYRRTEDLSLAKLTQQNVDTGMGLERTVAVLNGQKSVYDVSPLKDLIKFYENNTHEVRSPLVDMEFIKRKQRIIVDHLRAATFIMGDERGVLPGKDGQAYVVRKLLRRAILAATQTGFNYFNRDSSLGFLVNKIIEIYGLDYPELIKNQNKIISGLKDEEEKYSKVLNNARDLLDQFRHKYFMTHDLESEVLIDGQTLFEWRQSHGVPIEVIQDMTLNSHIKLDLAGYEAAEKKHQELSRSNAPGQFKGGLGGHSEIEIKLHTATHLLHQALRQVLGDHVMQKGSNITPERLRFDFSHSKKMTAEEITQVEALVNQQIQASLEIRCEVLSVTEAKERGAIGLFEDKYAAVGDKINVYFMGDWSKEICGGPHVANTKELGKFKILKEEAISQGVRRIKAIVE